jgi:alpha-tubulin suppressor-like RCC1 family protein
VGQIGDGTNEDRLTPVAVSAITTAVQIACGATVSCAVLDDGTARCWGSDSFGLLGNVEVGDSNLPVRVVDLDDAVQIDAGLGHACARRSGGGVRCWGSNTDGQVGLGSTTPGVVPTAMEVVGLDDAIDIQVGDSNTCALRQGGQITCWGADASLLTDSEEEQRSAPGATALLSDPVVFSANGRSACVVDPEGLVRCWGGNSTGQLGFEQGQGPEPRRVLFPAP